MNISAVWRNYKKGKNDRLIQLLAVHKCTDTTGYETFEDITNQTYHKTISNFDTDFSYSAVSTNKSFKIFFPHISWESSQVDPCTSTRHYNCKM